MGTATLFHGITLEWAIYVDIIGYPTFQQSDEGRDRYAGMVGYDLVTLGNIEKRLCYLANRESVVRTKDDTPLIVDLQGLSWRANGKDWSAAIWRYCKAYNLRIPSGGCKWYLGSI